MKKSIWRRLTGLLLCALICLSPIVTTDFSTVPVEAVAIDLPKVAYVPLDDRPVCVDRVIYQAESAGFEVLMPDADLYQTHLDGQLTNSNGTQIGDGYAIMQWLKKVDKTCDWFVISLDQMLSGGLVGSRANYTYSLTSKEREIINYLSDLSNDPNNHVFFFDTVMRLASTTYFGGYTSTEYNSFRDYGRAERKIFSLSNFMTTDYATSEACIQTIYDNYTTAADNSTIDFTAYNLTQQQINNYHAARHRKLEIINYIIQYTSDNASFIIGVDDASPNDNIQRNEINFIKTRMQMMGRNYTLAADADSLAMMAIAQVTNAYYSYYPTFRVRYYGGCENEPADDYDIGTYKENVDTHLEMVNCATVNYDADVELLVLTRPQVEASYPTYIDQLMTQLKENLAAHQPTIVIDCSGSSYYSDKNNIYNGVYGTNLQDRLCCEIDLGQLMAYSNWNTVGNSIGIAIGQGVARYTYLRNSNQITESSHTGFVKAMAYSYVKDITYLAKCKYFPLGHAMSGEDSGFTQWLDGNGFAPNGNFFTAMMAYSDGSDYKKDWELCRGEHVINNAIEWMMNKGWTAGNAYPYNGCAPQILQNLQNGEIFSNLNGTIELRGVENVSISRYRFPWYRAFEMTFDIDVTLESNFLKDFNNNQTVEQMIAALQNQYAGKTITVFNPYTNAEVTTGTVGTGFQAILSEGGTTASYYVVISRDVTGDGLCNTLDVRATMQNIVGQLDFSDAQQEAADQNGDSKVGSTDARVMLQKLI